MTSYAELCVTSNFTFLRGASHPEELVTRAAELGLAAIAITDRNSVAGVVRAYSALKELTRLRDEIGADSGAGEGGPTVRSQRVMDHSSRQAVPHFTVETAAPLLHDQPLPRLIPGARLVLTDSRVDWVALPTDLGAWSRLTRLLSLGKRRAEKGQCHIGMADLEAWGRGMILIALPPDPLEGQGAISDLRRIASRFAGQCFLGAAPVYDGQDQERLDRLAEMSQGTGLPLVAVGNVLMHRSARRPLADVLTCLREGCTIDNIGDRRLANGEHRPNPVRNSGGSSTATRRRSGARSRLPTAVPSAWTSCAINIPMRRGTANPRKPAWSGSPVKGFPGAIRAARRRRSSHGWRRNCA